MDSYFEEGVKLTGTLWVKGLVHFNGELEGEVFSSDHFMIGKTGVILGDIRCYDVTNIGRIKGNLLADHRVSLSEGSNLNGDITTYHLVIDEGSNFEGRCKMIEAAPARVATEKSASTYKKKLEKKKNTSLTVAKKLIIEAKSKARVIAAAVMGFGMVAGLMYPNFGKKAQEVTTANAYAFLDRNKLAEAEKEFKKALSSGLTSPEVYAGLGQVYMGQGKLDTAIDYFQQSVKKRPSEASYRLKLAKAYLANQQWKDGLEAFLKLTELDNANHEAFHGLGVIQVRNGKIEKAVKNLEMAVKLKPDFYESRKILGELYFKRGEYQKARIEIDRALGLNKEDPLLLLAAGELNLKQNRQQEAAKVFRKAAEMFPQNFQAQIRLADWYYEKGSLDESFRYYKVAESLGAKDSEVMSRLGKIYIDRQEKKEAKKAFQKAIKTNPKDGSSLFHLGSLLASEEKWDQAFSILDAARKVLPENDEIRYEMGRVLLAQGKPGMAESEIDEAIKLNPEPVDYYMVLSDVYVEQKKLDEAVDILSKAFGKNPKNAGLAHQLCQVYSKKGYYTVGIKHCSKAMALKPNFYNAMNRLAWLYAKKRINLTAAMELSKKTLQAFPDNPGYIDTLSEIYYVEGETAKAIDNIKKAIKLDPKESYYKQQLWKFKNVLPRAIEG